MTLLQMLRMEDVDANTPLLLGVESGSVDITRHLLERDADVNHFNKSKVKKLSIWAKVEFLDEIYTGRVNRLSLVFT